MLSIYGLKQIIEVILSGAVSTNELPITTSYEDSKGGPGKPARRTTHVATNGGTAVTALGAPGEGGTRSITGMVAHNADTASVTLTVRLSDTNTGAAVTRTLFKGVLLTLETLYFTKERGFFVLDANGFEKTSASGNSTTTSTADSKGVSAGLAASVAVSQLTSVDLAEDVTVSTADSKGVSAGLQGSVVLSTSTSADVRDSTQASTADSKATSSGLAASVALSTAASDGLAASVATSTNVVQSTAISTAVSTDALWSTNFSKLKSSNNGTGLP